MWQEIAEHLDDAILKLRESDRRVILLRYFEDRPIEEIASAIGINGVAARQRVHRALGALRKRLVRRGALLAGSAEFSELEMLMGAQAVRAAPPGLASAGLAAALGLSAKAAANSFMGILIAKGAMKMMAWTKIKVAAVVVGAVVIGGAGGVVGLRRAWAQSGGGQKPLAVSSLAVALPSVVGAPQPLANPHADNPKKEKPDVGPTRQRSRAKE